MMPPDTEEAMQDEVIAEVRAIREGLAAEFGHDLDRLFEAAKQWEAASDRPKRAPSPKRLAAPPDVRGPHAEPSAG